MIAIDFMVIYAVIAHGDRRSLRVNRRPWVRTSGTSNVSIPQPT